MVKKFIFVFLLTTSVLSFGKTIWNGEDGRLRVLYKILDPLIVTVEDPVRLRASSLDKQFTYSSKNGGRPLKVTVKAPYIKDSIDTYLRKVYELVYFELADNGKFDLINNKKVDSKIAAQGYFVDNDVKISAKEKKAFYYKKFTENVAGNNFNTTTGIDIEFTLPSGEIPMGVYTGDLILNVWFGGTIN